jgi:hypothetical protein
MQIHIPSEQRLRVSTNKERVFVDASSAPHQECLTIEFYSFQKQQIRSKSGTFKMFVFQKDQDITDFDFGFWSDAETVWQSF